MDKRRALRGIFWMLDNGAKWKDLPRRFGSKSAVHRWFTMWVREGVFEDLMRDAGELVEERDGLRDTNAVAVSPSPAPSTASESRIRYCGGIEENRPREDISRRVV